MKNKFLYLITTSMILGILFMPATTFAAYNYYTHSYDNGYWSNGYYYDDYGYYDSYGNYYPFETEDADSVKDTSWFDYENPKTEYKISTEGQLIGFASLVNEYQADRWKPTYFETFEGVTIILENDIQLTKKWEPIGSDTSICFKGTFDGNGHTISGLDIQTNAKKAGFFGYLEGTVKNLKLEGAVYSDAGEVGAVVGHLAPSGTIQNCTTNVAVSGHSKTGGICGYNDTGKIYDCVNLADVAGTIKVGGVVGENWGQVKKCGNRGTVYSNVSGAPTYGTGGVAGRSVSANAQIKYCYNVGNVISMTDATGGVVGFANATGSCITYSYNIGNIQAKKKKTSLLTSNYAYAGGVVGVVGLYGVKVDHCYNAGSIESTGISGGVIGKYDNVDCNGKDTNVTSNYFVNSLHYGVGANYTGKAQNISNGTTALSKGVIVNVDTKLGKPYMNDNAAAYGSNGYPVLSWQPLLINTEKSYLSHVSIQLQKQLDKFTKEQAGKTHPGDIILKFFNKNKNSISLPDDFDKVIKSLK